MGECMCFILRYDHTPRFAKRSNVLEPARARVIKRYVDVRRAITIPTNTVEECDGPRAACTHPPASIVAAFICKYKYLCFRNCNILHNFGVCAPIIAVFVCSYSHFSSLWHAVELRAQFDHTEYNAAIDRG